MARSRRNKRKRPTVRSNRRYIKAVDIRSRPPLKAYLEPTKENVELDFTDTLLLHKSKQDATLVTPYAHDKTFRNLTNTGAAAGNRNTAITSTIAEQPTTGNITLLECYRPLIYESQALLKAFCNEKQLIAGARTGRSIASAVVAGSFRIRMIEGINRAHLWTGHVSLKAHAGSPPPNGTIQYGKDGFMSPQFVRVLLVKVMDMGDGFGHGDPVSTATLQQSTNPNYRKDLAEGVGQDVGDTCNRHLLAPSLADLFDNVKVDPHSDYQSGVTAEHYRNEELIGWKYTGNKGGTPELGSTVDNANSLFNDPLRGQKRSRKFHIMMDRKIMFGAKGTVNLRANSSTGALQEDMKWSFKIKNMVCQISVLNDTQIDQQRFREEMSQRFLFYFIPSISPMTNGTMSATEGHGNGHHAFTVSRGSEKIWFTEKED